MDFSASGGRAERFNVAHAHKSRLLVGTVRLMGNAEQAKVAGKPKRPHMRDAPTAMLLTATSLHSGQTASANSTSRACDSLLVGDELPFRMRRVPTNARRASRLLLLKPITAPPLAGFASNAASRTPRRSPSAASSCSPLSPSPRAASSLAPRCHGRVMPRGPVGGHPRHASAYRSVSNGNSTRWR